MEKKDYIKQKINAYYKDRYKKKCIIDKYMDDINKDIIKRIFDNASKRLLKKLKELNIEKKYKYSELLGCSLEEFKNHISIQFQEGMNFDNYGEWEIDHIIPLTSYNLTDDTELLKCSNYKNLQPLWKLDNIKKSNKIPNLSS